MINEDDILIENFLKGSLSKEEVINFNLRLEKDTDFKEKFLFEKELYSTFNESEWNSRELNKELVNEYKESFISKETKDLETTLKKVENQFLNSSDRMKSSRKTFFLIAASVALLFLIYNLYPKSYSNQDLYTAYIQKENLPSLITRSENSSELIKGQEYFNNKDYDSALEIFKKYIDKEKENANLYLYAGISYLELNQYANAEKIFNTLINSNLIDASKGKWYLALTYIKSNKNSKGQTLLKQIVEDKSYNYKLAKELLKQIEV